MKPKIRALEDEKARLEGEARVAPPAEPVFLKGAAIASYRAMLADLASAFDGAPEPQRELRALISSVTVHKDYKLDITGDLAPLLGGNGCSGGPFFSSTPNHAVVFQISVAA